MVPKELVDAFVSVEPGEFPIELDYLLGNSKKMSALPVEGDTKKKLILLDALSTLFVDSNIIGTVKYQYSVEHIVKIINDSNMCCE